MQTHPAVSLLAHYWEHHNRADLKVPRWGHPTIIIKVFFSSFRDIRNCPLKLGTQATGSSRIQVFIYLLTLHGFQVALCPMYCIYGLHLPLFHFLPCCNTPHGTFLTIQMLLFETLPSKYFFFFYKGLHMQNSFPISIAFWETTGEGHMGHYSTTMSQALQTKVGGTKGNAGGNKSDYKGHSCQLPIISRDSLKLFRLIH